MMDELKEIASVIANLPSMALWVMAGFWAYKVIVIGSVYGVIKLGIDRLHSWAVRERHEYRQVRPLIDKITISGEVDALMAELHRIKGVTTRGYSGGYIHKSDIDWLREAISEKKERENKPK